MSAMDKGSSLKGSRLLLLLLSDLLLCQSVAAQPYCPNGPGSCRTPLPELFERAILLSEYIHTTIKDMSDRFNQRYAQGEALVTKTFERCHTASLSTPENKEQAQNIAPEELLSKVYSVMYSWNNPLYHLVAEMSKMLDPPDAILSRAIEIEEQNKRLIEGLEKIAGQVHPAITENEVYSVWSGLPSLQKPDEDDRIIAVKEMLRCLLRDSHKVDNFLKLLNCRINFNSNC